MTNYQENAIWRRGATDAEAARVSEIDAAIDRTKLANSVLIRERHTITLRAAKRARRRDERNDHA